MKLIISSCTNTQYSRIIVLLRNANYPSVLLCLLLCFHHSMQRHRVHGPDVMLEDSDMKMMLHVLMSTFFIAMVFSSNIATASESSLLALRICLQWFST